MDSAHRTALLRGALSVVAVVVFWLLWVTARFFAYMEFSTIDQLESAWGGPLLWIAVPQLLLSFLMVLVGVLVYGRSRIRSVAGASVVLTLPVLQVVIELVTALSNDAPGRVLFLRLVAGAIGIAAGYLLVLPRQTPTVSYRYH